MTKIENIIKSRFVPIIVLLIYALISLSRMLNHVPFFDEAHAWSLVEQLSFWEMVKEVKNEGHFFVWQTILYPFAKLHLYPYSMQFLNWSFCTIALILMWWKAPFNNITKALITFSFPFLGCYSVLARCYSIGLMLLFLLIILYKDKLKHPIIYSILLIFCANTSVMALIGASAFGFLFLYDLFKHKNLSLKDNIIVGSILSFGVILLLLQLLNIGYFDPVVHGRKIHVSIKLFRNVFAYNALWINLILIALFSIPVFKILYSKKDALFFISYTYFLLLLFLTTIYNGSFWHSYFFYVYLIIATWIITPELENIKYKNILISILSIISFILVIHGPSAAEHSIFYTSTQRAKRFVEFVKNDEILKNSQIIQNDGTLEESRPYLSNSGVKIRTHCDNTLCYDIALYNADHKFCAVKRTMVQAERNPKLIKDIVESTNLPTFTYLYLVDYVSENPLYEVKGDGFSVLFKKYKCTDEYCFWKIEIVNGKN